MPYGPHAADDRARMLEAIGIDSVDELFEDIPAGLRAGPLALDEPEPELQLTARLQALAARNRVDLASFLGAGAYRHWTPAVVDQMLLRGEWYTAYTPYQPEVSQGTLQSIYEYQSLLAELTGLDVVSASHYDGGAATAEAALMTCRATRRERILVSRAVHPHYRATLETYAEGAGLAVDEIPLVADGPLAGTTDLAALERLLAEPERPVAGVVAAQPNVLGLLEDMPRDRPPRPRRGRPVRGGHRARLARRPRAARPSTAPTSPPARASRWGSRWVRRPVPRDRRLHGSAGPPDPGPARGHDGGPRRQARVRHDDARPRAGHPPREGGDQHLHQPGAARAGRVHLPGRDRSARAAGRRGHRRGAGRGAGGGPGGGRGAAAPRRRRTSTSSSSASPTRGPSTPGSSSAASWPASRPRTCCPTSRPSPTACWCAPRRSPRATRSRGSRRPWPPSWPSPVAGRCARERRGRAAPADHLRAQRARPRRRQDPASAGRRPRPDPGRRPAGHPGGPARARRARGGPPLRQPVAAQLLRGHGLLPAGLVHHEVQPQAQRVGRPPARLREPAPAWPPTRPPRARSSSSGSSRGCWPRSAAWTRSPSSRPPAPTAS